jgi:putative ATP-dependent endonuclease of OLD family
MKIAKLLIENYKGLRNIEVPLSPFVCLIGENSAGKSSVLQALSLWFSGTALAKIHYFDDSRDVRIELSLEDIEDADLERLAEEHRTKIFDILKDRTLTLVRLYGSDGKSSLKYRKRCPRDPRFSDETLSELMKGKKAGRPFVDAVVAQFPELNGVATPTMNQTEMRSTIQRLADELPEDQKILVDADLPTGIDKSVSAMLPEPIYIPAVKDLRDDVKTTESTPFGKVIGMLLKAIEPELAAEKTLFDQLNAKLNRVAMPDGSTKDERLAPIKTIEDTVQRFVQESFKAVKLRITIPPPELKTVLSSAQIYADDGVDGLIDTKGDGLRRAIVFAVIRSYVELNKTGLIAEASAQTTTSSRYLLLFEEPELYLYPKAQELLFEALRVFSQRHRVVVTTHSPLFFGPEATTTFIKMRKKLDTASAPKPFGTARHIDLSDTTAKDQFQIICYENNNIAFFAETVVLVEGDSDYIVLPHLARIIDSEWDCRQLPIGFVRMGGKANVRRYREFFSRFEARVLVVTDLDFLLGSEFGQINPSDELRAQREALVAAIDRIVDAEGSSPQLSAERLRRTQERGDLRALWNRAKELEAQRKEGKATMEALNAAMNEFFGWERYWVREDVLKNCQEAGLLAQKRELIELLRLNGVCVLEKGTIEDYYPEGITGESKPARAQCFCNTVTSRERALTLCTNDHRNFDASVTSEFEAIFELIFGPSSGSASRHAVGPGPAQQS